MRCKDCGSDRVVVQAVNEHQRRGCIMVLIYMILLFVPVIGWIALYKLIRGKKSKTRSYCVCQDCGNQWRA